MLPSRADLAHQNVFIQPSWTVLQPNGASLDEIARGPLSQLISSKLDSVINAIDEEAFTGDEKDLSGFDI